MFNKFKPVWIVESVYQISAEQLEKHNIKAVFCDLDNTLIAWNNPNGTEELLAWIEEMKENGVKMIDETPRYGAGGARIAFCHPKSTGGVLVELSERED